MCAECGRKPEDVEVTQEMIRAGALELPPLYSPRDDTEDAVVRIFRAMAMAAPKRPAAK